MAIQNAKTVCRRHRVQTTFEARRDDKSPNPVVSYRSRRLQVYNLSGITVWTSYRNNAVDIRYRYYTQVPTSRTVISIGTYQCIYYYVRYCTQVYGMNRGI